MSADSNGIDVELVFKNNSADVVGSVFHDMMSNFYNPTGVCLTVRNMFTIYHSYLSFQRYTIYHSRGILFIIPEVYYIYVSSSSYPETCLHFSGLQLPLG